MKRADIVIPAYNESKNLEQSLKLLYSYLLKIKNVEWNVIIGENGSKDNTLDVAKKLAKKFPRLKVRHLNIPSRDNTLLTLWGESDADILVYMDADMSTNPKHTQELIDSIFDGYDIAIGSRIKEGAKVEREGIRVFLSNIYNKFLIPVILPTGVKDAQCGFKAINQKVAKSILPKLVKENGFMDTELLAVAKYKNYKVKEIPVEWTTGRESTMNVWKNIPNFLKNIFKTRWKIITGFYD